MKNLTVGLDQNFLSKSDKPKKKQIRKKANNTDEILRIKQSGKRELKRKPFPQLERSNGFDPMIEDMNLKGERYLAHFVATELLWDKLTKGSGKVEEVWGSEAKRRINAIIKSIGEKTYIKAKDFFDKYGKPKIRKLKMLILKKILTPEEIKTVKRYETLKLKEVQMEKGYANEKSTLKKMKLYAELKVLKLKIKKEEFKILLIVKRVLI